MREVRAASPFSRRRDCTSCRRTCKAGTCKAGRCIRQYELLEVLRVARAVPLDAVQLHGDESPQQCAAVAGEFEVIRALKVDAEFSAGGLGIRPLSWPAARHSVYGTWRLGRKFFLGEV